MTRQDENWVRTEIAGAPGESGESEAFAKSLTEAGFEFRHDEGRGFRVRLDERAGDELFTLTVLCGEGDWRDREALFRQVAASFRVYGA